MPEDILHTVTIENPRLCYSDGSAMRARFRLPAPRCRRSGRVVQPIRDVVDDPIEARDEILPSHGAAREYPPMVRLDGIQIQRL